MLNPKKEETVIDTAAGSSGFTVHSIFHVWQQILKEQNINASHLFTAAPKNEDCVNYVRNKVFAIEYDKKVVKVARCLNIIAGDGETNVLKLNSLYYPEWDDNAKDEEWRDTYGKGWKKFKELAREKGNWKYFDFDVLMANPPFAGDRDEYEIIELYQGLGQKDGKSVKNIGRDVLFIERNLNMLKDGGRMAVVLPQGRFNNSSDKHIREFIAENCRILAVIGLHPNTFQPHTGTKTSVLLVQKWTNDKGINPRKEDYPVFFATQQKPAKDVSGEKLFLRNENKELRLDEQEHPTIDHDLFSITLENGTSTPEGIAEAFIEFAKKEKLSFF
jgi:type I restriction enzyme M protein